MTNYIPVHQSLSQARKGEKAETEFLVFDSEFGCRYIQLKAEDGSVMVTTTKAEFDDERNVKIKQIEKIQAYDWEYTDKGWLIWEKAFSQNQEMDMHIITCF